MNSDAMNNLYQEHHNELYLYALSLCQREDMAKDLVNESFYKAFITSNLPTGTFKYWLFRVLKNLFLDAKRKNREVFKEDMDLKPVTVNEGGSPPGSLFLKERNRRLYEHLLRLEPERYREILYLYYYGELSVKEISKTIQESETHTKTLLYRARKKLGKNLKEDPYEF
ncbi:RNA polymerase sigma factor [Isachenkonia alkalipeptolytica]|uniref:RNA polymerase sigma factor n=1 Tax=Isachenkonia alkalipeptolytica TaxID=2565777 RepID=A0AA43XL58_9CLOT|nr:RNA polymerase sigma factor [Isachenkonia alkalipeptolytica]NBG88848.1 RNA polymerase sigma factor [Isachenkonia alkalipeptolytica]